jgi:eukaryotic-like serine/threonine-protein kinase
MRTLQALEPGTDCGPYVIVRELGRGGMGVVYLAEGPDGELCAIKTLQFARGLDAAKRKRFDREIRALASIRHRNVVGFKGVGRLNVAATGEVMYLVLEYVDGITLRDAIQARRRYAPEEIADLCAQIAEGVAAAHEQKIIHRDLKPENVMIEDHTRAKVIDFGLTKFRTLGASSSGSKRVGTFGYMAPEQLDSERLRDELDERVDIHALGLILYELASGEHAFAADCELNIHEMSGRTVNFTPPPLAEVVAGFPEELSDVAAKALAKRKEDRYASMLEMRDALDAIAGRIVQRRREAMLREFAPGMTLASPSPPPATSLEEAGAPEPASGPAGGFQPGQPRTVKIGVPDEALAHPRARSAERTNPAAPVDFASSTEPAPAAGESTTSEGLSVAPEEAAPLSLGAVRNLRVAGAFSGVAAAAVAFAIMRLAGTWLDPASAGPVSAASAERATIAKAPSTTAAPTPVQLAEAAQPIEPAIAPSSPSSTPGPQVPRRTAKLPPPPAPAKKPPPEFPDDGYAELLPIPSLAPSSAPRAKPTH